jgi:flagellar biosynthesis/type III secretory pathway chaperone
MSDLRGLKEVLCAQCDVHRRLLNLEEEKTRVLLSGDAGKLTPLLNDQQALLMQSRELEKQRNAACLGSGCKTLRELVESGEEPNALLKTVFEELAAVVAALKKKCALNKKLLETRLGTIRFLLNQSGQETGVNTYTKNMSSKG